MNLTKRVAILVASLSLVVCAHADPDAVVFKLRFIDSETRQPIANTTFNLVPVMRISDPAPGQTLADPNLKFAKRIRTDSTGVADLPEALIEDLTKHDVRVNGDATPYGRFSLTRTESLLSKPVYRITVFKRDLVHRSFKIHRHRKNTIPLHLESERPN